MFHLFACLSFSVAVLGAVPANAGGSRYRFVSPQLEQAQSDALAEFGPFIVLNETTAALVDITDGDSPSEFTRLLAAYPQVTTLRFIEMPGTFDDVANMQLGRMIRAAGLNTVAPKGGSVRSGGVELFLAGVARIIDQDAEFAVHAWIDDAGLSARDYAANSPENRKYVEYYREMGMDNAQADAFYAMTNSVPFEDALWLSGKDMRDWIDAIQPEQVSVISQAQFPRLAYLDLGPSLN